jgi:hypothetical protein
MSENDQELDLASKAIIEKVFVNYLNYNLLSDSSLL